MTTPADDEEWSELLDFHPDRVDLVKSAANGTRFLIAKQDEASAGLLDPDFVRSLIAKGEPEPSGGKRKRMELPNGITLKGSPAAMAAFIHSASVRKEEAGEDDDVAKAAKKPAPHYKGVTQAAKHKYVADLKDSSKNPTHDIVSAIRRMSQYAASGHLPHGVTYSELHWMYDQASKELHKRDPKSSAGGNFPKLGSGVKKAAEDDDAGTDAGTEVAKCQAMQSLFDDAGAEVKKAAAPDIPDLLAEPDKNTPGDPGDPGSPAWEQVDSDTAAQWTAYLAGAKAAVQALIDREMTEAATVDPDDAGNAADLASASDAIDYAIGILAPFAVGEQSEADCGTADLQAVGKAAAGAEEPARVITGLVSVAKAGRVLSSANEERIRAASKALQEVLGSLPSAPDSGSVAKEGAAMDGTETTGDVAKAASAEEQAKDKGPVDAQASDHMGGDSAKPKKAGKKQGKEKTKVKKATAPKAGKRVKVYDKAGQLAGKVAKADISLTIAKAGDGTEMMAVFNANGDLVGVVDPSKVQAVSGASAPKPAAAPDKGAEQPPAQPPADPAASGATPDLTPQPSAAVGTRAEDVQKSGEPEDVAKGAEVIGQLREMLDRYEAGRAEAVAKQAADNDTLKAQLEEVRKRLATVEEQPAMPRVVSNGVIPPAQLRGQDAAAPVDVAKAAELKNTLYTGSGPEQVRAFNEMAGMATARLQQIRGGASRSPAAAG